MLVVVGCQTASRTPPLNQVAYLKASNPRAYAHFGEGGPRPGHTGSAVSVSGDGGTIAVGAPHEGSAAAGINGDQQDESAPGAGAVYVYTRRGAAWSQQAYVKASNTGSGDYFGSTVDLSADGNTMAVAARGEASAATGINGNQADNSIPHAGAVYVFTRTGDRWTQQAYIKASNTGERLSDGGDGDQFGISMALSADGDTLAVGAVGEDSAATGIDGNQADNSAISAGAVYVFRRMAGVWGQEAYLKPETAADVATLDLFGFSVDLSGDGNTLAVGVYDEAGSSRSINGPIDAQRSGAGAVYVFRRAATAWSREAYIKTWNAEAGDSWGVAVSVSEDGNTLAVGAIDEDCLCTGVHTAPQVGDGDRETALSTGAAAVFIRNGTAWTQQAYLKASNSGQDDWFGVRLALSGDGNTLAIGAQNEDSGARGLNGAQNDESADDAVAVYLYSRTGQQWSQIGYLKGSNIEAADEFGAAVGLSRDGRTLAVGALGEDGGLPGAAGNPEDNSVDEAGAAYIFTR